MRCLCHEAELGIAALFDESIRIISANFICLGHISNDIGRRPDIMSKDFCRLRSKLLLQQALNFSRCPSHRKDPMLRLRWRCESSILGHLHTQCLGISESHFIQSEVVVKAPKVLNYYPSILSRDFI